MWSVRGEYCPRPSTIGGVAWRWRGLPWLADRQTLLACGLLPRALFPFIVSCPVLSWCSLLSCPCSLGARFSLALVLSPLLPVLMGRPPWASPEQIEYLETFVPNLEAEKRGNGLKPYYDRISAEFKKRWPTEPTDKERKAAENPQEAQRSADNRRTSVRPFHRSFGGRG